MFVFLIQIQIHLQAIYICNKPGIYFDNAA